MSEESSLIEDQKDRENGQVDKPQQIIDKYIKTPDLLDRLISIRPETKQPVLQMAQREMATLDNRETEGLLGNLLRMIGTETPLDNDDDTISNHRDAALELLRVVDLKKADPAQLLAGYTEQVRTLPGYADIYGAIGTLLEAGELIAPHLPDRRISAAPISRAWRQVSDRFIQDRDYINLLNRWSELVGNLPLPAETPLTVPPAAMIPQPVKPPVILSGSVLTSSTPEKPKVSKPSPKKHQEKVPNRSTKEEQVFREIIRGAGEFIVEPSVLPWIEKAEAITLDHVVLNQSGEVGCYLGSCIRGSGPVEVSSERYLNAHQRKLAYNAFYSVLPDFLTRHRADNLGILDHVTTQEKIYYARNKGGQRLYFMEMGKINNESVIVIIGICDKSRQIPILLTFTTQDQKTIKFRGGL